VSRIVATKSKPVRLLNGEQHYEQRTLAVHCEGEPCEYWSITCERPWLAGAGGFGNKTHKVGSKSYIKRKWGSLS
jgi:hypothetical protein